MQAATLYWVSAASVAAHVCCNCKACTCVLLEVKVSSSQHAKTLTWAADLLGLSNQRAYSTTSSSYIMAPYTNSRTMLRAPRCAGHRKDFTTSNLKEHIAFKTTAITHGHLKLSRQPTVGDIWHCPQSTYVAPPAFQDTRCKLQAAAAAGVATLQQLGQPMAQQVVGRPTKHSRLLSPATAACSTDTTQCSLSRSTSTS
jgi:hypothetical protein